MRLRPFLILVAALALSTRAEATTPEMPWIDLWRRTVREGAAASRAEFQNTTHRLLRSAEIASEVPNSTGYSPKFCEFGSLNVWCQAWVDAEIYGILKNGQVPDEFDSEVWKPLMRQWTQFELGTHELIESASSSVERLRLTGSPSELKRAERELRNMRAEEWKLPYEMAVLAALANRPDLVNDVLQASGGDIREPERTGHPDFQGRSYASVPEFMELDHAARCQELIQQVEWEAAPRVYPADRETERLNSGRWKAPLMMILVLIAGLVVLWNRRKFRQLLFPRG